MPAAHAVGKDQQRAKIRAPAFKIQIAAQGLAAPVRELHRFGCKVLKIRRCKIVKIRTPLLPIAERRAKHRPREDQAKQQN